MRCLSDQRIAGRLCPPACRQLGSVINGQRATLAEPAVFFGILHSFAEELEAAHSENAEADAAADAASSARKVGRVYWGRARGHVCRLA